MIFQIVQVASFVGFVATLWKRVSAANTSISQIREVGSLASFKK